MFTLGRKIDINYPTNRWIVVIAIIVTGIGFLFTKKFSIAWKMGASVFLTWALTREIDPKREYGAFASAFLALASLFVAFKVDLMVVFFLLLTMRFVSKVTGDKNTILDMITLFGFAGFLSYNGETSVYILILIVGLYLNMKATKNKKLNTVFYALAILTLLVMFFIQGGYSLSPSSFTQKWIIISSAISLFAFVVFILFDRDKSTTDDNGQIVEAYKILRGQIFFAISVGLLVILTIVSIGNLIVYLSSIWGYMIYGVYSMLIKKKIQG